MSWMILIAVAGMVWLIISATKGVQVIINDFREHKWRVWRVRFWNRYTRDFVISILIILGGTLVFVGVTGMVVGLLTSFFVSIYLQITAKRHPTTHPQ